MNGFTADNSPVLRVGAGSRTLNESPGYADMHVAVARPSEQIAALELLFQHLSRPAAHARIVAAQQLLDDPSARLLVARDRGIILASTLVQVVPGATGVIWPPCANGVKDVEDALLVEALDSLRRGGAKLAQAILAPSDAHLAKPLLRGGFSNPTQLCYLRFDLRQNKVPIVDGNFETYGRGNESTFHDLLMRTYHDTLDFPEVDGLRSLDEIVQGYKSSGYDPSRWFMSCDYGGVLILAESEPGEVWELSYVGVVPEARRRGHGRALVRKAIAETSAHGIDVLMVAVDARNTPACQLYRSEGFKEFDRRDVFLSLFRAPGT